MSITAAQTLYAHWNALSILRVKHNGQWKTSTEIYAKINGVWTPSVTVYTKTNKFVTLKGSFKDARGNVVDTDWTYGVGAAGLAPGESTTFRLSVPKNYDIVSCSVSIMDYD